MNCRVLHVVRRFGPVGGMERYVWRLTSELLELGVEIDILCQSIECDVDPRITVHQLAPSTDRRRWKAMRDFRNKCDQFWLEFQAKDDVIVHSHERCSFHHVTTFHGPPMPSLEFVPWYQKFSRRIRAWKRWEMEEILGSQVQCVVPVSLFLRSELEYLYPSVNQKFQIVIPPGINSEKNASFVRPVDGLRCIFVGKEWRRKGLERAIEILAKVNKRGLPLTLDVYGPDSKEVDLGILPPWVKLKGYVNDIPFSQYDLLIHPATKEPFGMVVTEALSNGCRALISDKVGARDLRHPAIRVVEVDSHDGVWISALDELIEEAGDIAYEFQTWRDAASNYLTWVYKALMHRLNKQYRSS